MLLFSEHTSYRARPQLGFQSCSAPVALKFTRALSDIVKQTDRHLTDTTVSREAVKALPRDHGPTYRARSPAPLMGKGSGIAIKGHENQGFDS